MFESELQITDFTNNIPMTNILNHSDIDTKCENMDENIVDEIKLSNFCQWIHENIDNNIPEFNGEDIFSNIGDEYYNTNVDDISMYNAPMAPIYLPTFCCHLDATNCSIPYDTSSSNSPSYFVSNSSAFSFSEDFLKLGDEPELFHDYFNQENRETSGPRRVGRPRGSYCTTKKVPKINTCLVKKMGKLWEFLRNLLFDKKTCPSLIKWDNHNEGTFKFVECEKVAKLWGDRKQNNRMNYEKLSRAMRYYYRSKVLLPVAGKRLVYKFGPYATGWRTNNPILE